MWAIKPECLIHAAGCWFRLPAVVVAVVNQDGETRPVLEMRLADTGKLETKLTILCKKGHWVGDVVMGEDRMRRGFVDKNQPGVLISAGPTHWRVMKADTCATVCEIQRVHNGTGGHLEVSLSMWLAARPVKITPDASNLTDLKPAGHHLAPLARASIILTPGVRIEHEPQEIAFHVRGMIGGD